MFGADSATATILTAGLVGLAATGADEYVALAAVLPFMAAGFLCSLALCHLPSQKDRKWLLGFGYWSPGSSLRFW